MLCLSAFELYSRWVPLYKHRRTGQGGEGGCSPPQILGNLVFLGSTRKFGQSQFLKTSACSSYYYLQEIIIFYFNLKSA